MRMLFFDLETSPNLVWTFGLWNQNISIGQIVEPTKVLCFGAQFLGEKKVHFYSVHHDGQKKMREELHKLMDEADVICGWNSASFDHPHIRREFIEAKMPPPSPTKDYDLMKVAKVARWPSNKLDYVAQRLGVGKKVQHEGFQLWVKCMAGDPKAWKVMKRYQIQDVRVLVGLYEELLPWAGKKHPSRAVIDDIEDACPACGKSDFMKRGFENLSTGKFQRFQCRNCSAWSRSKSSVTSTDKRII